MLRAQATLAQLERDPRRSQDAYLALRQIWGSWDNVSPTLVQEALLRAETSPRLSPPVRAYAGLLTAYARLRRGDPDFARQKIRSLGYVDRWLIAGPFDNEGKNGLDTAFEPESEFNAPMVPGRLYAGKERGVKWRRVPNVFAYGYVDTGALLQPNSKVCAYLTTFVRSAAKRPRRMTAWVGTLGAFKLFFNGRELLTDTAYRGHDADRFSVDLDVQPASNNLTIKVCGDEDAPVASLRLANENGAPDASLTVSNEFVDSRTAAKLADMAPQPNQSKRARQTGPLQRYQAEAQRDDVTADTLERYARYLVLTHGDDPTEHLARDLARRAAELEPTLERLLLAGELAEDRNKRARWLAEAVRQRPQDNWAQIQLLLAQAHQKNSGPNPREASPYFDRVLALDPDNLDALQGQVEVYNEAGLHRTALSTLSRALDRNPHSVGLLNMYASQLRALGRASEAAAVESRYSALRFDDTRYLHQMIELAARRQNRAAAQRWVSRLLAVDPASAWAHRIAARTFRALGEPARALSSYEAALELSPEDVGTLRGTANLLGELGRRQEQLDYLQRILKVRPQERAVREYLEHIHPPKARPDEAYAWKASRFLPLRHAPPKGENRRTLRELTVNTVFENGLSSQFRQVVFQPLTDSAAAMARQYVFSYHGDTQQVRLRGARVYRGDGKIDEAVEYGEAAANDPTISMYTSGRNFYVQFPRLEPGDVVELRYRIDDVTPRNELADYFGEVAYLQSLESVQNAEYVLITPKSRVVHVDQQIEGLTRQVTEQGKQRIYRFFAKRIPGLHPEPHMPPLPEILGFVHVSTYKSWKDLGRWYWGLIKDQFDLDEETRQLANRVARGRKTDLDKVKAVYNWVVKNTRYVALEFGIYGYKPRRCVQTVARGWGDCKDKATVIVTLLKELGIDSTIVIVRSQLKGRFRSKLPSLAPFDHAIVYVPSLDLYLDGTAEYAGVTELPKMDLGALALQVNKGEAKLVHLPEADPKKNVIERRALVRLKTDGSAELDLSYETRGVSAPEWRLRYQADATVVERLSEDLGREFPGFSMARGGLEKNDLTDFEQPVRIRVRGSAPQLARLEGERLSLAVTPQLALTQNFASLSARQRALRILSFDTRIDEFVVDLPAGATVVEAPPQENIVTRFGSYSINVEQKNNRVTIKSRVMISKTRVSPREYPAFKQFCERADRALGTRLIVKP